MRRYPTHVWTDKNGGCGLHNRPRATFGCGDCLKEIPALRAEIKRLRKIIERAARDMRGKP